MRNIEAQLRRETAAEARFKERRILEEGRTAGLGVFREQ
jgi:hypothetical protein